MQWLILFIGQLIQRLFAFYLASFTLKTARFLVWVSIILGLFIALSLLIKALIAGVVPLLPDGALFGLGMIPPVAENYVQIYLTAIAAKRIFDWKVLILTQYENRVNSMRY